MSSEPPRLASADSRSSLSAISPSVASSAASPAPEPDLDSALAAVAEKAQARARGDTQTGDKADDDSDDDEAFDQVPDFLRTNLLSGMSPQPASNSRAYVPSAMPTLDTGFDSHQTRNRRSSFEPSDRSNEEWEGVMIKTFTRWVNTCLIARGLHVSDLIVGLHDGVILVHLVEILSKKSLGRFNSSPRLTIQKLENVTKVLDFLRQGGAKMVNIGAQDVVFGNQKIILGLLWTLILKYQMDGHVDSSVKERLMAFVQEKCNKKYGLNVYNFSTCFQDGRAVSALTNALAPEGEPDPIDMNKLLPTPLQNIERAMHIAETVYGIPRVMDPQDLAERPDTHSVMTYVSFFLKKVSEEDQRRSAQQAAVEAAVRSWLEPKKCIVDGPGLGPEYVMGRPAYFTLHLKDKENKRFLPSSLVTGAAAQALLDKPKPPGGHHERKVSLSAVPPPSVSHVPGSGHPSQPVLLIAQLDRVRKHSKSVRGSLPATIGPAPDALSDAGSEAEVRSEAGLVSALLAVERDVSGSSLPEAPGPLEGEFLSDVMRPRSVTMPNVAVPPAFRPFPSRLPPPVSETEEEDTCARLECRVLDNKDGTISISYNFPALLREVKETLARAAEVDPELVAPERLDSALKQVKDAREAAGAEYMLRVELNGEPVAGLPKPVRFAHDPELMAAMEEVETRVAAIRATVAERKRARDEAAEKNKKAQQEAEAARERAARAEEEAVRLRKALEEAEETRRRAEAEQAERAAIERKQSEEHQRNETELQQQLLATAQREAEERARLKAAEEERERLAKALEEAEKERKKREAEAKLDAEAQTDEVRLLSQEADAGTQTDWFGLGEHDTVSAMEAERAQLARELESERARADELGHESLSLQTQLGELTQRVLQLQTEREEAVANARARAHSELERAQMAEEDAKRAAEKLAAEQSARAQLEQAQAERARRLEDKARARMEKRRRDAEERAQERVERQQLIEALQKAMARLETVKAERDGARKDRDAWKAKYEQAVKDMDASTPRSSSTEPRSLLAKQKTLVGGSLGLAREDSKSELDLENDGADERLLRQKMRLRIKALEDGEKRSASELTLSNRRFEAQRVELRQVKTEAAREIGNLRKELVDAQTELTGLRGESSKRQRLIEMAKQTLTGLQPWVGLEISASSSRPSSRTNLHAGLAPSKSGSMAAISEDGAATAEPEQHEADDAKSEAGSEAPSLSSMAESDQRAGVLVYSVKTGGPAAQAGFKKGDLIEQVDGEFTRSNSLLRGIIAKALPGDTLSFQVNRASEMLHITVRVGSKTLDYDAITELRRIANGIVRAGDEKYMRELKRRTFSKAEANSHIRLPGLASSESSAKGPSPSPSTDPLSPPPS